MDHFRVLYSNTDCFDIHWLRMICMMIKYVGDHFEMVVPNATCIEYRNINTCFITVHILD